MVQVHQEQSDEHSAKRQNMPKDMVIPKCIEHH